MKWISLLDMEYRSNSGTKDMREIYTQTPQQRYKHLITLINR